MAFFQGNEEILSALYVDFDNIYARLLGQDEAHARTFATHPQRWLRWIEGHALRMMYGEGAKRRILKRICYMCPEHYQEFRPFFLSSAFHVVECSHRNNRGKTNADIHMVMDCMDTLYHPTQFSEFILLAGDADFTPLLLKIQESARRSIVLSAGYTSPAYTAACSWRIREDWFMAQALEEPRPDQDNRDERSMGQPTPKEPRSENIQAKAGQMDITRQTPPPNGLNLPEPTRLRLVEFIRGLVAESNVPVPLPSISQAISRELDSTPDWFGAGKLRTLLTKLPLEPLEFSRMNQGYVLDPSRHERPIDASVLDDFMLANPGLYEFAMKVHRLTDIPLLHPESYDRLFDFIIAEHKTNRSLRPEVLLAIDERCEKEGLPIDFCQIDFVARAAWPTRDRTRAAAAPATRKTVREAYYRNALELCALAQMPLGKTEQTLLSQWLGQAES